MNSTKISPDLLEEQATSVVKCITRFVDLLRTEFPIIPSNNSNNTKNNKNRLLTSNGTQTNQSPKNPTLFSSCNQSGLLTEVQSAINACGIPSLPYDYESNDERVLLAYQIIFPLIQSLASTYQALDSLPEEPKPPTEPRHDTTGSRRRRRKPAPTPPRGLLSIQNYTDIACLLEFAVCSYILPALDPHVLVSLDDRIQYQLPKSLAGRIPRQSLSWGQDWAKSNHHHHHQSSPPHKLLLDASKSIAQVVTLDRFRPMLLPRHIADLYASLFQYEQRTTNTDTTIATTPIYADLGLVSNQTKNPLDATLQAKAYQTLLLQGTKSPPWVRQKVAPLLTELACQNLAAIVQVFVPLQESSMASQRLGRTLAVSMKNSPTTIAAMGNQMRLLLEILFSTLCQGEIPARAVAILQTIWAVLTEGPKDASFTKALFAPWHAAFEDSSPSRQDTRVHKAIRQMGALCAFVPPFSDSVSVLTHLLKPSPTTYLSLLDHLVRVAALPSVIVSQAKIDSHQSLQWLSCALDGPSTVKTNHSTTTASSGTKGLNLLTAAWVRTLGPLGWDLSGKSYKVPTSQPRNDASSASKSLEVICVQSTEMVGGFGVGALVDDVTSRVKVFLETVLDAAIKATPTNPSLSTFPSHIFQLLLRLYFVNSPKEEETTLWSHRLVASILLPELHEKSSPEALLFGKEDNPKDAMDLLNLIQVILSSADGSTQNEDSIPASTVAALEEDSSIDQMLRFLHSLDAVNDPLLQAFNDDVRHDALDVKETLVAMISIVLSLLIAVLELGSKVRSPREEAKLKSFLPTLTSLSSLSREAPSQDENRAGLADMAGYALALIASRGVSSLRPLASDSKEQLSTRERLLSLIQEADDDLQSTQPPMRARGMVSLGRLARGYLGILSPESLKQKGGASLVTDLQKGDSDTELIPFLIGEVLRLSMKALADEESYVYLAAVQTIVAIGDIRPRNVIPILGSAIISGSFHSGSNNDMASLSQEQRVKLTESLIFVIRRRGSLDEFVDLLMNQMLFGENTNNRIGKGPEGDPLKAEQKRQFAMQTHQYFKNGVKPGEASNGDEDGIQLSAKQKLNDQDIRVKTGGPIFSAEEADVVRSLPLSVLSELVSSVHPSLLSSTCHVLVDVTVDVLRLDKSRTVCRMAALLARQLYGCLLREGEIYERRDNNASPALPFAVALISSKEERLQTILKQYASSQSVGTGLEHHDPTTSIRSEEALSLRAEAEAAGIFVAAASLLAEQRERSQLPSILTLMATSKVPHGGMMPLVVDMDSVGL